MSTRPQRRVTVEPNIYRYPSGELEAELRIAGYPRQRQRFDAGTAIEKVRRWLADTALTLKGTPAPRTVEARAFGELTADGRRRPGANSLELDAPGYWIQIAGKPRYKADRSHTRAWFDVLVDGRRLGAYRRSEITWRHVNIAIAQWQTGPSPHAIRKVRVTGYARPAAAVAAHTIAATTVQAHARAGGQAGTIASYQREGSTMAAHTRAAAIIPDYERTAPATGGTIVSDLTIRHRCRVLEECYRLLDGKHAPTPIADAHVPARPKSVPVTVPVATIDATLRTLSQRDPKTFARFAVAATCAQRPCQLQRAQPSDVLLEAGTWLVRDAKGAPAHTITLDEPQLAAWAVFIVAEAWGTFDTGKYGKLVHAAGWPHGIRPYAARASFAAAAIRNGVSLGDLQGLLGHKSPLTTRKFYAAFQIDRQRLVSATMKDYLAGVFKLQLVKGGKADA